MKLGPLAIYALGIMIGLVALFWGLFWEFIPNTHDAAAYDANTELQNAEAAKQNQANKRVERAIAAVKAKDEVWQSVVATRTPPNSLDAGGIDLNVNAYQLAVNTKVYRNNIQRAVNAQLVKGGVEVVDAPFIPLPDNNLSNGLLASFYNYPAIPFPVVIFNLGQITVRGSYKQICDNVRSWKTMPHYLAVTDHLAFNGTSPVLTATYNLSIVGFIRGKQIFPAVPEGAATAAGGGRGGFGGFRGGQPGPPGIGNIPPGIPGGGFPRG